MIETRHTVRVLETSDQGLRLEVDGRAVTVAWAELSPRLEKAPQVVRETIRISPAGYGLLWPLLDDDLSIDGILRDFGGGS
ncbi:MAG: DUF2442 domain-containing protein [Spirochaetes bacterium]|jgi:hypothetical protein|nr:DUF2442 domain-containing protein [Spirochaetota bacterium]